MLCRPQRCLLPPSPLCCAHCSCHCPAGFPMPASLPACRWPAAMTPQLTFHDPSLEASFWAQPAVARHLMGCDKLALPAAVVNTVIYSVLIRRAGLDDVASMHLAMCAVMLAVQLAAVCQLLRRPEWYYSRRTNIMVLHRFFRLVVLYSSVAGVYRTFQSQGAALVATHARYIGVLSGQTTVYAVLKAVLLSGCLPYAWTMVFTFPICYAVQIPLVLLALPGLLLQGHTTMLVIGRKEFSGAVCALHAGVRRLSWPLRAAAAALAGAPSPPACPSPIATQFVVYWFTVVFGVALPLAVVYFIESRFRLRYLHLLLGQSSRMHLPALLLNAAAVLVLFTWCLEWCL